MNSLTEETNISLPNPEQVYYQLYEAIRLDKRPAIMLKEYLDSGSVSANLVGSQIFGNKKALALLSSPAGRAWIHRWVDDFLNYMAIMARTP